MTLPIKTEAYKTSDGKIYKTLYGACLNEAKIQLYKQTIEEYETDYPDSIKECASGSGKLLYKHILDSDCDEYLEWKTWPQIDDYYGRKSRLASKIKQSFDTEKLKELTELTEREARLMEVLEEYVEAVHTRVVHCTNDVPGYELMVYTSTMDKARRLLNDK